MTEQDIEDIMNKGRECFPTAYVSINWAKDWFVNAATYHKQLSKEQYINLHHYASMPNRAVFAGYVWDRANKHWNTKLGRVLRD